MIEALSASHEKRLARDIQAALDDLLAAVNVDQLASSLDDTHAAHIRDQLTLILELADTGTPQALDGAMQLVSAALVSFVGAVAALAAAHARYVLNPHGGIIAEARAAAAAVMQRYLADTAAALSIAIENAIYGPGTPFARAAQLRRSIGLTVRQAASLDVMQAALRRYLDTPRRFVPARTDANGIRVSASYARNVDTRAILAATRGRISAAQRKIVASAIANPKLTEADADRLLDTHAAALRSFRIRATVGEGVHLLAETAKLAGWRIAQQFGAMPANQRRYWIDAGDERVRHSHAQVKVMNAAGVPLHEPFVTPFGERMNAPLEWGCRCKASLRLP